MAAPSVKILSSHEFFSLEITTFSLPRISFSKSTDEIPIISIKEEKEREREKERWISRANIGCFRLPTQRCHSREIAPEIHPSGVDEKKRNRKTGGLPRRLQIDLVYTLLTEREKREGGGGGEADGGGRVRGWQVYPLSMLLPRCIEMERRKRLYLLYFTKWEWANNRINSPLIHEIK